MAEHEFDLRYVNTCLGMLSHYLKSDELYYPLGLTMPMTSSPYPQLTPGNLLFYLTRLKGARDANLLSAHLAEDVTRAEEEFDILFNEWAANWNKKVVQEIEARIRQWSNYLTDLSSSPEDNKPHYHTEVRTRTIIDLLTLYCIDPPSAVDVLPALDQNLRSRFTSGSFIWESDFAPAFPSETYWYLWGTIN